MRRDIEKTYSRKAFVAKLRRLADALARGECFALQVAGRRVIVRRGGVFGIERYGRIHAEPYQEIRARGRRLAAGHALVTERLGWRAGSSRAAGKTP